jgi:hypothetical protein
MRGTALRRFGGVLGYALYGTGALALALWLLFPREAVRGSLEKMLGSVWPDLHWQVGDVSLGLPVDLALSPVEGYARKGDTTPLVRFERVSIRWYLLDSVLSWSGRVGYHMVVGKGSIIGKARWQGAHDGGRIEGTVLNVNPADAPWISRQLGRAIQGSFSGTFTADVRPESSPAITLEGRFDMVNGRLSLKRPILGFRELPFTKAGVTVHGQGEAFVLSLGTVTSHLFDGRFSGTMTLRHDSGFGQIDVQGVAEFKDSFFKGLDNTVNLQAFRLQLKDNALPFNIIGELASPGIYYGEHAMLVQDLEQELR